MTVIVSWEAVIQRAQGESRKERSKKVCMRSHRVTPEEMAQVKVSKEEKRRRKLPNQGDQISVEDRTTWSKVHRAYGVRTTKKKTNLNRV